MADMKLRHINDNCPITQMRVTLHRRKIKSSEATSPKGSRMMSPPGVLINLRSHMTLTFDLLTSKVYYFMPLLVHLFSKYHVHFTRLVRDEQTTGLEHNAFSRQCGLAET